MVGKRPDGLRQLLYLVACANVDRRVILAAGYPVDRFFQPADRPGGDIFDNHENHDKHNSAADKEHINKRLYLLDCARQRANADPNYHENIVGSHRQCDFPDKEQLSALRAAGGDEFLAAGHALSQRGDVHAVHQAVCGGSGGIQLRGGYQLGAGAIQSDKVHLRLFIVAAESVQRVCGGRCLAFRGKQVFVLAVLRLPADNAAHKILIAVCDELRFMAVVCSNDILHLRNYYQVRQ